MLNLLRLIKDLLRLLNHFIFKRKINKTMSLENYENYKNNRENKDKSWQYLIRSFELDSSNSKIFLEIYNQINSKYFNNKRDLLRIYLSNNFFDIKFLYKYCNLFLKKNNSLSNIKIEYLLIEKDKFDEELINNSINWLITCQKTSQDRRICTGFDLINNKITNSFPETTGYIIPTFIEFSKLEKNDNIYKISVEMGDWILDLIRNDGGLGEPYGFFKPYPRIFTTAQAILGLLSLYDVSKQEKYITAATKLGKFLINNLNNDGSWNNDYTFLKKTTTYKTRVSWIMMLLYQYTKNHDFKISSINNLKFILLNETRSFWPLSCTFEKNNNALTHLLGYHLVALINFVNSNIVNDKILENELINHVDYFYKKLNILLDKEQTLSAVINSEFKNIENYTCLTGNAQIMFFALLYEKNNELKNNLLSSKIYNIIFNKQIKSKNKDINGAIAGSFPINGNYAPYMLPSWASKFFIDSLLLKNLKKINFTFLG